jgi:hypothetical protein
MDLDRTVGIKAMEMISLPPRDRYDRAAVVVSFSIDAFDRFEHEWRGMWALWRSLLAKRG